MEDDCKAERRGNRDADDDDDSFEEIFDKDGDEDVEGAQCHVRVPRVVWVTFYNNADLHRKFCFTKENLI
jgi:hypothetical protein